VDIVRDSAFATPEEIQASEVIPAVLTADDKELPARVFGEHLEQDSNIVFVIVDEMGSTAFGKACEIRRPRSSALAFRIERQHTADVAITVTRFPEVVRVRRLNSLHWMPDDEKKLAPSKPITLRVKILMNVGPHAQGNLGSQGGRVAVLWTLMRLVFSANLILQESEEPPALPT